MANTANIDLVKPAGTDHALISVINSNSDKIDAEAGRQRGNFAGTYSSTSGYAVGDYCIYQGNLYRCTTAIGSSGENWTAGHWTSVNVGTELKGLSDQIANIETKSSWTTITVDSNNTYTIPYDGTLYITCGTSDNNNGYLTYSISTWRTIRLNVFGQLSTYQYIPVAKDDVIAFVNQSSNITDVLIQFRRM